MKFTLDTKNKEITILEDCTFEEMDKIRKFLGKDCEGWTITTTYKSYTPVLPIYPATPYYQPRDPNHSNYVNNKGV